MWNSEKVLAWTAKLILTLFMLLVSRQYTSTHVNRVQVLVLGDIGRSPRMQYHALSLAKHGCQVDLIGYLESPPHSEILTAPNIHIHSLTTFPHFLKTKSGTLFLLYGPLKVLFQISTLLFVLGWSTHPPRCILAQNPPSIPTLFAAYAICLIRGSRFIIDWHNFGYSILALRFGEAHPLVRISRFYEWIFARYASHHLCVTEAMAKALRHEYVIKAPILTLHDRPAAVFQVLDKTQRSSFLEGLPKLLVNSEVLTGDFPRDSEALAATSEVQIAKDAIESVRSGACRLIVSATSWTPDEDFSILLSALLKYTEDATYSNDSRPKILAIITGKGPQKADFEAQLRKLNNERKLELIMIRTAYFDNIADYAKLLGSADLGISLHTSSSGVDLPMKVVDMFGTGLPVAGWGNFEAWPELVKEKVNGWSFEDAAGLANILTTLFAENPRILTRLKDGALREGKRRWDDEWDSVAGELFDSITRD